MLTGIKLNFVSNIVIVFCHENDCWITELCWWLVLIVLMISLDMEKVMKKEIFAVFHSHYFVNNVHVYAQMCHSKMFFLYQKVDYIEDLLFPAFNLAAFGICIYMRVQCIYMYMSAMSTVAFNNQFPVVMIHQYV